TTDQNRIYLTLNITGQKTKRFSVKSSNLNSDIDKLVKGASLEVLRVTDPATLAYHYYRQGPQYFTKALKVIERSEFSSTKDRKWLLNLKGRILTSKNEYFNAFSSLIKAIKEDYEFLSAYNNLGIALYNHPSTSTDTLAVRLLSFANSIDSKSTYRYSRYSLGKVYTKLGHYDSAIMSYENATKIDPNYALAKNNVAYVLRLMGEYDKSTTIALNAMFNATDKNKALLWSTWAESKYYLGQVDSFYYGIRKSVSLNSKTVQNYLKDEPYSCFKNDEIFNKLIGDNYEK
ncbi:MAG: tetratricopeptide repeat protein, partial [Bacteroidota bacterium]